MQSADDGTPDRPDPRALLADVTRDRKGSLKIFIGACPGVGKTYAMLQAAREAKRQGVDIVLGVIESHGRSETEMLRDGMETIPLLEVTYQGTVFQEMDLDAIVRRSPDVVLVDELAHRNVPGSRHPRRYQDIGELMRQGIDVWTTVNIQHLESLNDAVARITGVRMREMVPDALIAEARDIELVDLPPRELLERLRQGKVYLPEQARAAMNGFFSPSNLAALRDLVFQTVANRIDEDVREAMRSKGIGGPWPVRSRLVVAVTGSEQDEDIVRQGSRIAEHRRAPWCVVFVETEAGEATQRLSVERVFQTARRLGGDTVTLRGHDPIVELLRYAREQNATTLVTGRHRKRGLNGLWGRWSSQRLLRKAGDFEVTFAVSSVERIGSRRRSLWPPGPISHYAYALFIMGMAILIAAAVKPLLPLANLSLVFLTAVLVVAVRTAIWPALFTALLGALGYNFFFTEPLFTFYINRHDDLVTIAFFLIMAVIGGQIAVRLRSQVTALRATNEQTRAMLTLNQRVASAADMATIGREVVKTFAEYVHVPVVFLAPAGDEGRLLPGARSNGSADLDDKAIAAAQWSFDHNQSSGMQTDTLAGVLWRFLPLGADDVCFGVVGLLFPEGGFPGNALMLAIEAMAGQAVLAMARVRLSISLEQAKLGEETERLRSALLSSVSHDLRTPLATMIGAASSLRTLDSDLTPDDRAELLDSVWSEAQRLDRYIQNLLDMTRLGYGTLKLERDWIGIEDILNSALRRTREMYRGRHLVREIETHLPLLYVHPALIEQALVNVIENAGKFSPEGSTIRVGATLDNHDMRITVTDEGPGIPAAERQRVFDLFFTGSRGDSGKHGTGLGLAICRGMIGAHGGRIVALPGVDGRGTTIAIHLPLPPQQDPGPESTE